MADQNTNTGTSNSIPPPSYTERLESTFNYAWYSNAIGAEPNLSEKYNETHIDLGVSSIGESVETYYTELFYSGSTSLHGKSLILNFRPNKYSEVITYKYTFATTNSGPIRIGNIISYNVGSSNSSETIELRNTAWTNLLAQMNNGDINTKNWNTNIYNYQFIQDLDDLDEYTLSAVTLNNIPYICGTQGGIFTNSTGYIIDAGSIAYSISNVTLPVDNTISFNISTGVITVNSDLTITSVNLIFGYIGGSPLESIPLQLSTSNPLPLSFYFDIEYVPAVAPIEDAPVEEGGGEA